MTIQTIFILGGVQALFSFGILFFSPSRKRKANRYLALFMLTLLCENLFVLFQDSGILSHFLYEICRFNFLTMTFLFFYVIEIVGVKLKNGIIEYLPAIVELVILSVMELAIHLSPGFLSENAGFIFERTYSVLTTTYVIVMCIRMILLIREHQIALPSFYANVYSKSLKWLEVFCWGSIILILFVQCNDFFIQSQELTTTLSIFYTVFLCYFISIGGIKQMNIENRLEIKKEGASFEEKTDSGLTKMFSEIEKIMLSKKLYLNPKLNLKGFSIEVNLSQRQVSQAINSVGLKNFYAYVNDYRIEEAKRLLNDKELIEKFSISTIAAEVGYNSRASFYKNFNTYTNQSPTEYIQSQQLK